MWKTELTFVGGYPDTFLKNIRYPDTCERRIIPNPRFNYLLSMPSYQGCRGYGNPHTDGNGIGMGIWFSPVGIPTGKNHIPILNTITWVWGYQYEYPYGYPNMDPHTHGIVLRIGIWFSPVGIPIWISIWGYLYGDPHGDSHRNPSGMRWEWEWKFPPHGNPASYCILSISHNNYAYLFIELYYYGGKAYCVHNTTWF